MRSVELPSGVTVPALGQGTWKMGVDPARRRAEVAALRLGIDLGMTLIDTAEMYGEGGAEEVVGEAIAGRRDEVFVVSKVYPHNASPKGVAGACARSLRRLRTDAIDLYLLHWRGAIPLDETVAGFEDLVAAGKIRAWGVSNLDVDDLEELLAEPAGERVAADQVLYHLGQRGIEWDLLPWGQRRQVVVMAYSPLGEGELLSSPPLRAIAERAEVTPAQLALAWVLRERGVVAIPKAVSVGHLRENRAAADLELGPEILAELDRAFPPPRRKAPLATT